MDGIALGRLSCCSNTIVLVKDTLRDMFFAAVFNTVYRDVCAIELISSQNSGTYYVGIHLVC